MIGQFKHKTHLTSLSNKFIVLIFWFSITATNNCRRIVTKITRNVGSPLDRFKIYSTHPTCFLARSVVEIKIKWFWPSLSFFFMDSELMLTTCSSYKLTAYTKCSLAAASSWPFAGARRAAFIKSSYTLSLADSFNCLFALHYTRRPE